MAGSSARSMSHRVFRYVFNLVCHRTPVLDLLTRVIQVKDINACLADGMLSISWPRTIPLPTLQQVPTHVLGMA
jgi:hypothetical protein